MKDIDTRVHFSATVKGRIPWSLRTSSEQLDNSAQARVLWGRFLGWIHLE